MKHFISCMYSFVSRIALIFIGIMMGLLFCEFIIRLFIPQSTYGGGRAFDDPDVFDLKANFAGTFSHLDYTYVANINQDRMRVTKEFPDSPSDVSVFVLGDSFTFGTGVNDGETFSSIIVQELHQSGIHAKVTNGGVPAYSLNEVQCKYERYKNTVPADIVVIVACFNDWRANIGCGNYERKPRVTNTNLSLLQWRRYYPIIRNTLLSHSQFAVFLSIRLNDLLIKTGIRASFHSTMAAYSPQAYVEAKNLVQSVQDVLSHLHAEIQQDEKIGVFVYIPGYLEINDTLWETAVKIKETEFERDLPHTYLVQSAIKAGFEYIIDPLNDPAVIETLKKGYYPIDMHLNVRGHEVFGEIIARKIREICIQNLSQKQ